MQKNSTYRHVLMILAIVFMASSCAQINHHSNPSQADTPSSEQIQEPDTGQSQLPIAQEERIHIEDKNAQIDELRVRGETETIQVKPQNDMPAYEIVPYSPAHPDDNAAGRSRWRVLSF
ncbi:MAG: hypothetical protein ACRCWR_05950 [Saezia sp.]